MWSKPQKIKRYHLYLYKNEYLDKEVSFQAEIVGVLTFCEDVALR
jgi:hypothetical protein